MLTADLRCSTRIVFPYVLAHRVGEQIACETVWPRRAGSAGVTRRWSAVGDHSA
ncbi:hypothetical protein ACFPM0_01820 [Pseudonocardia sulfidoxydans]|uniref:hypothetical protein n=1 Tax=Pseudonocardia sulfidoxydans TaxID=54011 RepID=UPI003612240F